MEVVASVAWEKVEQVLGHRMTETDYYPPRWLVDDFPSEDEFEELGNDGL
jgi:hypothetical protein